MHNPNATTLVVDLEATCSDDGSIDVEHMETIEIGACWVEPDGTLLERFQSFVRPVVNPRLTSFCTNLTGIQQEDVDEAPLFSTAAAAFSQFVERHKVASSIWMSWGTYDHKQLVRDSARHGVNHPIMIPHQNAKRMFAKAQRIGKEVGMAKACALAGLSLEGTHHRALDDALNVARLLPWAFGTRNIRSK